MADLFIIIKRKYFDQIKAGAKKEEYREMTEYWSNRLIDRNYDNIIFQAGYQKESPRLKVKFNGVERKKITHEFFNNETKEVFAIQLGDKIYT